MGNEYNIRMNSMIVENISYVQIIHMIKLLTEKNPPV